MNLSNLLFLTILVFLLEGCASHPQTNLCPKIFLHSKENFELTDVEKRLVCGDEEVAAYKLIPSYQASYMLTGFFQSRGYSTPRFEYSGDQLDIYPGVKSFVEHIVAISDNPSNSQMLEEEMLRQYKGEVITPKLLDNIEAASLTLLRNNTYPCSKIESTVDASLGTVTIKMMGLNPFQYGNIAKDKVEGLEDSAFDRFYPFIASDYFSEKKMTLAEKRFLRAGVVQGTYFQESCVGAGRDQTFSLAQKFILGTSRTIRLGVGASTEVGPLVRAKWSNQRSGVMASLLEASLQLSAKNQSFNFISDRYMWPDVPRRSLLTTFEIERDNQNTYEELSAKFKPHFQWTRDGSSRGWTWSTGPTLIASWYETNATNDESKKVKTGALEGMLQTKSHNYEVFDLHPEEGDFMLFNFDFRHPAMGFTDPLLKLNLSYLRLFRLGDLGRGSAILGVKGNASTTWVPDDVRLDDLQPSVKFYGGGSDDIRGFKLSQLPDNNGLGALTKLSLKLELRKTYVFIPTIESFVFVDGVYFGKRSWEIEERLWYSPGAGMRWLSPIGLVQTYLARALSNKSVKDEGNLFYLGLGGTF